MKKQKFCYAAVTACVGLCSLGSCTQEEMAYQGEEEDISKLKVITRTDDESSKPVEGKIYIFNQAEFFKMKAQLRIKMCK